MIIINNIDEIIMNVKVILSILKPEITLTLILFSVFKPEELTAVALI